MSKSNKNRNKQKSAGVPIPKPVERKRAEHNLLPSETVLPDNYQMMGDYVYIMDNVFKRCELLYCTVAEYKRQYNLAEIRRCDLFGHEGARLGDIAK